MNTKTFALVTMDAASGEVKNATFISGVSAKQLALEVAAKMGVCYCFDYGKGAKLTNEAILNAMHTSANKYTNIATDGRKAICQERIFNDAIKAARQLYNGKRLEFAVDKVSRFGECFKVMTVQG